MSKRFFKTQYFLEAPVHLLQKLGSALCCSPFPISIFLLFLFLFTIYRFDDRTIKKLQQSLFQI